MTDASGEVEIVLISDSTTGRKDNQIFIFLFTDYCNILRSISLSQQ